MASAPTTARSGHASIVIDEDGTPRLRAFRCGRCFAVVPEPTMACRACAAREAPEPFTPANQGTLHAWSIVHRSYPGVAVPFVSAIVDLEDGLSLKGTLRAAGEDELDAKLRAGLPVRVVFDDAGGATDKEGTPFFGFHFELQETNP